MQERCSYAIIVGLVELGPDVLHLGEPKDWSVVVAIYLFLINFPQFFKWLGVMVCDNSKANLNPEKCHARRYSSKI